MAKLSVRSSSILLLLVLLGCFLLLLLGSAQVGEAARTSKTKKPSVNKPVDANSNDDYSHEGDIENVSGKPDLHHHHVHVHPKGKSEKKQVASDKRNSQSEMLGWLHTLPRPPSRKPKPRLGSKEEATNQKVWPWNPNIYKVETPFDLCRWHHDDPSSCIPNETIKKKWLDTRTPEAFCRHCDFAVPAMCQAPHRQNNWLHCEECELKCDGLRPKVTTTTTTSTTTTTTTTSTTTAKPSTTTTTSSTSAQPTKPANSSPVSSAPSAPINIRAKDDDDEHDD